MIEHGGADLGPAVRWDFSTNANPMGPLAGAVQALAQADRRIYPEPSYLALRQRLAEAGLAPLERLLPSAGNAEAIRRLTLAARLAGCRHVWVPQPGYAEYRVAAETLGLSVRGYDSVASLTQALRDALTGTSPEPALVWLCEPCNPSGDDVPQRDWDALSALWPTAAQAGCTLAIDRAYAPMRLDGDDPLPNGLIDASWQLWSPNKALGCTGVRAGMVVAPLTRAPGWPDLAALAPSWVLGSEGVALLSVWLSDGVQAGLRVQRGVWAAWMRTQQALLRDFGWTVRDAVVPFFLARPPEGQPLDLLLPALREQGIKLRDATSLGLPGWCRLRVMPPEAQDALRAALKALAPEPAPEPDVDADVDVDAAAPSTEEDACAPGP